MFTEALAHCFSTAGCCIYTAFCICSPVLTEPKHTIQNLQTELNCQLHLCPFNSNPQFRLRGVYAQPVHACVPIDTIHKYTLLSKIIMALLIWTCPVEEFRNINLPEIQFTFQDRRIWMAKRSRRRLCSDNSWAPAHLPVPAAVQFSRDKRVPGEE